MFKLVIVVLANYVDPTIVAVPGTFPTLNACLARAVEMNAQTEMVSAECSMTPEALARATQPE